MNLVQRSDLSADQVVAFDSVVSWLADPNRRQWFILGGYAGTGKTTVTAALAEMFAQDEIRVRYCAYTGKAASVLKNKMTGFQINASCISTIHGLLYKPIVNEETGKVEGWAKLRAVEADLIVVDEGSMIPKGIWEDLKALELPILVVGDHGQLPPVGDTPQLMQNPDARLEKIHRQALGNPILALATHVRAGRKLERFEPSDNRVRFLNDFLSVAHTMSLEHVSICYTNATRVLLNTIVRERLSLPTGTPTDGDLVVCLKNANKIHVFNGMRGILSGSHPDPAWPEHLRAQVFFPQENTQIPEVRMNLEQFGQPTFKQFSDIKRSRYTSWDDVGMLFDYGYVLTCHKMQGSQAQEVTIAVEKWLGKTEEDRRRWLYTACTRASERLNLVLED